MAARRWAGQQGVLANGLASQQVWTGSSVGGRGSRLLILFPRLLNHPPTPQDEAKICGCPGPTPTAYIALECLPTGM